MAAGRTLYESIARDFKNAYRMAEDGTTNPVDMVDYLRRQIAASLVLDNPSSFNIERFYAACAIPPAGPIGRKDLDDLTFTEDEKARGYTKREG